MAHGNVSGGGARILEHLTAALSESLSSMTGQNFAVAPGNGVAPDLEGAMVWQQGFSGIPEPCLWVAAGGKLWTSAGRMVLAAVGIDSAAPEDCRSTWVEIAGQTMGGFAMRVTADVQHEVTAVRGEEVGELPDIQPVSLAITCGDLSWGIAVAWSASLTHLYEPRPALPPASAEGAFSKTFDLLLDVALPVSVSFGKTTLPIREVLKLNTGSIVELNRLVNEPVEVIVNDCVIARGEVVVVEGNYGVRVTHLASREDRIRTGMNVSVKSAGAGK